MNEPITDERDEYGLDASGREAAAGLTEKWGEDETHACTKRVFDAMRDHIDALSDQCSILKEEVALRFNDLLLQSDELEGMTERHEAQRQRADRLLESFSLVEADNVRLRTEMQSLVDLLRRIYSNDGSHDTNEGLEVEIVATLNHHGIYAMSIGDDDSRTPETK